MKPELSQGRLLIEIARGNAKALESAVLNVKIDHPAKEVETSPKSAYRIPRQYSDKAP